ncbi:MAG: clostripain-related cysteine peptidase [Candidatus Babeliales bacterium]
MKKFIYIIFFTLIYNFSFFNVKSSEIQIKNPQEEKILQETKKIKDWNFLVYAASNNDLFDSALRNVSQMMEVGSTQNINILVQLDTFGKKEICRYYVEKNRLIPLDLHQNSPDSISGTPENLYKFAKWGIENFPATHQAFVVWDHGSGIEDPSIWGKILNNVEIFKDRGIAFNTTFQTYLTNQDLKNVLESISKNLLSNKKIDIFAMDACNMAMLEVASQIKNAVNFMVGSENIEPAAGWNYKKVLLPFENKTMTPEEFSKHIVKAYKAEYEHKDIKYTQSALKLEKIDLLEKNVDEASSCLLEILKSKDKNKIISLIKKIRNSRQLTTTFPDDAYSSDGSYIDMYHFYKSFLEKINQSLSSFKEKVLIQNLSAVLYYGLHLIFENVIENVANVNLSNAKGLAIYFPPKKIHGSYLKTVFAQNNNWKNFLKEYLINSKLMYGKNKQKNKTKSTQIQYKQIC